MWNLGKEDDVRKYVIRRTVHPRNPDKKPYTKAPKIQRLITPRRLQRKRRLKAVQRRRAEESKEEAAEYKKLLATRLKQAKQKHREDVKRRHLSSSSAASTAKPKGPLEISVDQFLEKPGKINQKLHRR